MSCGQQTRLGSAPSTQVTEVIAPLRSRPRPQTLSRVPQHPQVQGAISAASPAHRVEGEFVPFKKEDPLKSTERNNNEWLPTTVRVVARAVA